MAFDFATWIIGYSLTKLATNIIETTKRESFSQELNQLVQNWASNLPKELFVEPDSIFPSNNNFGERNNTALDNLREKILKNQLPTVNDWTHAILERWRYIKNSIGDGAQKFYLIEENEALIYIDKLALQLDNKCRLNNDLFKIQVLTHLETIIEQINYLKPKESLQEIIQSKLSIINELKNSILILNKSWPLQPTFSRDDCEFENMHKIIEEAILSIHFTYSLIIPIAQEGGYDDKIKKFKTRLIDSFNHYLSAVDKFYDGDMDATMLLLEDESPDIDLESNFKKWIITTELMINILKVELEKH